VAIFSYLACVVSFKNFLGSKSFSYRPLCSKMTWSVCISSRVACRKTESLTAKCRSCFLAFCICAIPCLGSSVASTPLRVRLSFVCLALLVLLTVLLFSGLPNKSRFFNENCFGACVLLMICWAETLFFFFLNGEMLAMAHHENKIKISALAAFGGQGL